MIINYHGTSDGFGQNNIQATIFAAMDDKPIIELDIVLSNDNQPVVFHDIYLDKTTDVASVYPDRSRNDGRYYVIDFSFSELKSLQFTSPQTGETGRYLSGFEEQLALITALENKLSKTIGIAPKLVKTWFHKMEGSDLSGRALSGLQKYGYTSREKAVFLQSYDSEELQRIHNTLLPMMQMDIRLIQLIGDNNSQQMMLVEGGYISPYNFDWIFSNFGLRSLSTYADGTCFVWPPSHEVQQLEHLTRFIANSKKLSLTTYATLLNQDQDTYNEQLETLLFSLQVDGIKTNTPKEAAIFIKKKESEAPSIHELLPQLNITHKGTTAPQKNKSPLSILKELQ